MQEVLLFGINELSERINYYISRGESVTPLSAAGFVIDDDYYDTDNFAGKKVYRYFEAKEKFLQTASMIICIGYKNMNENCKKIFHRLRADGRNIEGFTSTKASISTENIGVGNIFLPGSSVGDCCFFGMNSTVANSIHIHDKTFVGAACYLNHSTKKPGNCYVPPKAILLGSSEQAMDLFTTNGLHWR